MRGWWLLLGFACGDPPPPPVSDWRSLADGSACKFHGQCVNKNCVAGKCSSGAIGAACGTDADCESGYCNTGKCATNNLGARCKGSHDCRGSWVHCFHGTCRGLVARGGTCENDDQCFARLTCVDKTCLSVADLQARNDRIEEERRRELAANDARMLMESGVRPDPGQIEKIVHPPGRGQRVRTVSVSGTGKVFAACKADERLVGGSCKPGVTAFPSDYGAEDTVGARWNCEGSDYDRITTYALCMKLP